MNIEVLLNSLNEDGAEIWEKYKIIRTNMIKVTNAVLFTLMVITYLILL